MAANDPAFQERTFHITVTMRNRWIPSFLGMLKYMEQLGGLGGSRLVSLYSDGDGDFQPKFEFIGVDDVEPATQITDDNGNRIYDAG